MTKNDLCILSHNLLFRKWLKHYQRYNIADNIIIQYNLFGVGENLHDEHEDVLGDAHCLPTLQGILDVAPEPLEKLIDFLFMVFV